MSDLLPKAPPTRKTGLSPKEQKLQALRDKMSNGASAAKAGAAAGNSGFKAKNSFTGKKTAFQRKAT